MSFERFSGGPIPRNLPAIQVRWDCRLEQAYDPAWPKGLVPTEPDAKGRYWTIDGWLIALKERRTRTEDERQIRMYDDAIASIERQIIEIEAKQKRKRRNRKKEAKDGQPLGTDSAA